MSTGTVERKSDHTSAPRSEPKSRHVGEVVGQDDEQHVEQHLEDAPLVREVYEERDERLLARGLHLGLVVDLDAREVDADERQRDREPENHRDPRVVLELPHHHRQKPRRAREPVEHPDRAPLRQPQRDQTVRRVVAPALRRRAPRELAHDRHERRVEDRDEEDEHGDGDDDDEAAPAVTRGREQSRAGEEEADEHRPAVAHEDRRRVRVVDEEADERRGEDREHRRPRSSAR